MEESMHGSLNRSGDDHDNIYKRWGIGIFALPVLLAMTLIGLAIFQPAASNWISEAVQAEFAPANTAPEPAPTQIARPAMEMRTVRTN
jgi:hypothetical protein